MKICTIMPTLSIDLATKCIDTLLNQTLKPIHILPITPIKSVYSKLKETYSKCENVHVIYSRRNLHYAGHVNLAYLYYRREIGDRVDIFHITNDDVEYVDAYCLEKIANIFRHGSKIGIVGPVLLRNREELDSAGACLNHLGIAWECLHGYPRHILPRNRLVMFTLVVTGASMFVNSRLVEERRKIFQTMLTSFYEDVELSLYSVDRGYLNLIRLDTYAIHGRNITYRGNIVKWYLSSRNSLAIIVRTCPRQLIPAVLARIGQALYLDEKELKTMILRSIMRGVRLGLELRDTARRFYYNTRMSPILVNDVKNIGKIERKLRPILKLFKISKLQPLKTFTEKTYKK